MKRFAFGLLVLFFLAPLRLFAITPICYPWQITAAGFEQTTQPTNLVKWLSMDATRASFVVSWYCDEKYGWGQYYFYGYRSQLSPNWQTILGQSASLTKAQADAIWSANVTTSDARLEAIAARQLDASRPSPITWRVRPNGTQSNRPVFRLNSDGSRNQLAVSGERVKVGEPCWCARKSVEEPISGSDAVNSYCSVEGLDNAATPTLDQLPSNHIAWCVRDP